MKAEMPPKSNLIKFFVVVSIVNLVIGVVAISLHYKNDKIVYVDALKLLGKYKGREAAQKSLAAKAQVWKSNLDTLKHEFEKILAEQESRYKNANATEKKLAAELLQSKQQQYLSYEQSIKEQYDREDKDLSKRVLDKVNDYVRRYGEAHGYVIILASTQYGNLAYAKEGLDITDKVLVGLNEEYNK